MRIALLCMALGVSSLLPLSGGTLDFYFMDVEAGNATLIVTPSGKAILIDGGSQRPAGRNAGRFFSLAKRLGIKELEYLLVTHYHDDHYGATPEISRGIRVVNWADHGPNAEHGKDAAWQKHWQIGVDERLYAEYLKAQGNSRHVVLRAGDRFAAGEVSVDVVNSAGEVIATPLGGAGEPTPYCAATPLRSEDETEDGQSIGVVITFGRFRYASLGDLNWNRSRKLFCPENLIGPVDVYLTTHHGMSIDRGTSEIRWGRSCCPEAEVHGLRPRVAILNSGERYHRLGTPRAWQVVRNSPELEDFWQLHYVADGGKDNNVHERFIANLSAENCQGHLIKLSTSADGSFTVTNGRNGFTRSYAPGAKRRPE